MHECRQSLDSNFFVFVGKEVGIQYTDAYRLYSGEASTVGQVHRHTLTGTRLLVVIHSDQTVSGGSRCGDINVWFGNWNSADWY